MIDFNAMFPDEREKGETTLRQCQLVMLRLLKIFDYICAKHEIEYFLIGGSLIGAVRHQGFIPWDDDLDVGMTQQNYEKFIKYGAEELPHDIFFQNFSTDKYYRATDCVEARLRDKYSSYKHLDGTQNKWHEGLQLDIFVFRKVYLPNKVSIILENIIINKLYSNPHKRANFYKKIENFLGEGLVYCNNWLKSLGMVKFGVNYFKSNEIEQTLKMPFEDMQASIPVGYDKFLSRQFGNYMKLPPEDKRKTNHNVHADPFAPCNHLETLVWDNNK